MKVEKISKNHMMALAPNPRKRTLLHRLKNMLFKIKEEKEESEIDKLFTKVGDFEILDMRAFAEWLEKPLNNGIKK